MTRPAVLVDRDDTLIVDVPYLRDPDLVRPIAGAAQALRALAARGAAVVIISNQSGIGRGAITADEAAAVHARVIAVFADAGLAFAGAYYCPHAPEAGCPCRKPAPALLRQAAAELGLDLARSVMIGDKGSDVAAGLAAGCRALRFAAHDAPTELRATADVVGWEDAGPRIAALLELEYDTRA